MISLTCAYSTANSRSFASNFLLAVPAPITPLSLLDWVELSLSLRLLSRLPFPFPSFAPPDRSALGEGPASASSPSTEAGAA